MKLLNNPMSSIEQSEAASIEPSKKPASRRVLYETVILLVLMFVAQFLPQGPRMIFTFAPLVYFVVEHYLRRRTWTEAGFNFRTIPRAFAANWFLILLVSVLIQFAVTWAAKSWMPAFIDHVIARLPFPLGQTVDYLPMLLASTLIGALFEEISFRALLQERLGWFFPAPVAIGVVSVIFGIGHWASGEPVIVGIDVLLVILDSIFYGIIFARSKNIYVVWLTHCLANLFAFGFVLLLP
jgi:membrane protease YdiL (CAAX protease family)